MTINQKLFDSFPKTLDENEFSALLKLISLVENKADVLKVEQDQYNGLFNYGRDLWARPNRQSPNFFSRKEIY